MRKRTIYSLVLAALLVASNSFAAKVTNVELTYQSGQTVAKIDVDGTVRFTHQTEIAKDGKPFRVIVDVLSATHELGAKSFLSLPKCAVLHIRSSQYSIKPERIVRLVFDMSAETVYQIESDTKSIKLYFPNKSSKAFAAWSTRNVVSVPAKEKSQNKILVAASNSAVSAVSKSAKLTSKTAAQLNRSIEADRQASIASSTTPSSASGSKASYPPDHEAANVELKKTAQNASASAAKSPNAAKGSVATKSQAGNEAYASHAETSKKAETTRHSSTAKNSPRVSDPRTALPSVGTGKTVVPKVEAKSAVGPVMASNSDQVKTKQPLVKKAKVESSVASEKKTARQSGSSDKAGSAVQPGSTSKSEQTVSGKPSTVSQDESPAAKGSVKKAVGSKAKLNASEKSSKAAKSSPVKPEPKKKKKAVYASADQAKSSPAAKAVPKKGTNAKGEKKVATKSVKKKKQASSGKSASGSSKKVTQKKADNQRTTSRFRRSRAQSNKIKGTMVAEFPKRLVIKYRGKSRRDPFETLVNDRKTNNSLQERKVPNAEGLKLVGVIEAADGDNRALFEDTDGFGYIMKSGDKVRKGYVLRVELDRVYFQIFEYGWSRTVALNLEEY